MQLPDELKDKINSLLQDLPLSILIRESEHLSDKYRSHRTDFNLHSDNQRLAYLAARFPATYAAARRVLEELKNNFKIQSLLDIGAGPGTLLLAATEMGGELKQATLIERDAGFIRLGKQLTASMTHIKQDWLCRDVNKNFTFSPHDLVVASYSLNELAEKERTKILEMLWAMTGKFLVIIEPGTKPAFESLKRMRQQLLSYGAHLFAPCPHSENCPLKENDWCHFSVRIERSSIHRKTKLATLNYEDEKFSYLIFSKEKIAPCQSRVLRHPNKGSGFIKLQLCSKSGIENRIITKKNKQQYSEYKKIKWGDPLN